MTQSLTKNIDNIEKRFFCIKKQYNLYHGLIKLHLQFVRTINELEELFIYVAKQNECIIEFKKLEIEALNLKEILKNEKYK